MPRADWLETQRKLVAQENWILDGDLGGYDAVEVRVAAADTIILLNFSLVRCAWRALRRGRERADFWKWLIFYRQRSLPQLMEAIAAFGPHAELHLIRSPKELGRLVAELERKSQGKK